jgi:hypothetical protein
MSQARGPAATGAGSGDDRRDMPRFVGIPRFVRKVSAGLALAVVALSLGGCGNCGGWTFPWYKGEAPHSCHSEPGPEGGTLLLPAE